MKTRKIEQGCALIIWILGLYACGNKEIQAVTEALDGTTWFSTVASNSGTAWAFDGSVVAALTNIDGHALGEADMGKFIVKKGCIALTWDNADSGRVSELYYTYEHSELSLYTDSGKKNSLTRIK